MGKSSFGAPAEGASTKPKRKVRRRTAEPEPVVETEPEPEPTPPVKKKVVRRKKPAPFGEGDTVSVMIEGFDEAIEATVMSVLGTDAQILFQEFDENDKEIDTEETVAIADMTLVAKAEPAVDAKAEVVEEEAPPAPEKKKRKPRKTKAEKEAEAAAEVEETQVAVVEEEEETQVAVVEENQTAVFIPERVGHTGGEFEASMYDRPWLGISHAVGNLNKNHDWDPGNLVLGDDIGLHEYKKSDPIEIIALSYVVRLNEKLPYDEDSDVVPRVFATSKEARDAGVNPDWGKDENGKGVPPQVDRSFQILTLVKEPEECYDQKGEVFEADMFNIEFKEERFAMAFMSIRGVGFDYASGKFLTAAPRKDPHHWRLNLSLNYWKRPKGENKVYVPHFSRKDKREKHDDDFIAFLEDLL